MPSEEIRRRFLEFFRARGHAIVPSSSLIPDDPSVLLTTAGMQQFKPYFLGKADPIKDFGGINTASIQKSFRTSDIDLVGDESHLTFFEMLGNFSFGGYFKKEAIEYGYEFIVKELGLEIHYVTVFGGDPSINSRQALPEDEESAKIWQSLGVKDIRKGSRENNFWGPTGNEGPCGPTTEIYVNGVEVWNLVFNEYYCHPDGKLEKLKTHGVDTGMGLERLAMVLQKTPTIFETDLFQKPFGVTLITPGGTRVETPRIIADHVRGLVFLIADGVRPSNKDAGYILRRLIRRVVIQLGVGKFGLSSDQVISVTSKRIEAVIDFYGEFYSKLTAQRKEVLKVFVDEGERFDKTLENGLREFYKKYPKLQAQILKRGESYQPHVLQRISADDAFYFHQSFGLTIDIIRDLARDGGHVVDEEGFEKLFEKHQEVSRAGAEKKFGGHGLILNTGELKAGSEVELKKVTRLHTATHLLQWALREVLGKEIKQAGSDITPERTRFDFTFPRKLTPEEAKKVEDLVNQKIKENLPVGFKEMPKNEAEKTGALYFFKEKYPDKVKVYYIGKSLESAISKEFCGGPHVDHTGEIGKFRVSKEEAVGAGVRRIRGVIE